MSGEVQESTIIAYYIISAISIMGSIVVIGTTLWYGSFKSCFTFLILCFHISLLGEEIATLPHVYNEDEDLCISMQFFHFYFSLMNILVVTMLVEAHRSSILQDFFQSRAKILRFGGYFIILFPLITLLAFVDHGYYVPINDDNSGWCAPRNSASWSIGIYFIWVWIFLIIIVAIFVTSFIKILKQNREIAVTFSSTIGLYVVVAILSWIPRSFGWLVRANNSPLMLAIAYFPINISGLLYTLIFLREKKYIIQFSESVDEVSTSMSFSWEKSDLLDMMRGSGAHRTSESSISIHNPVFLKPSLTTINEEVFGHGGRTSSTATEDLM